MYVSYFCVFLCVLLSLHICLCAHMCMRSCLDPSVHPSVHLFNTSTYFDTLCNQTRPAAQHLVDWPPPQHEEGPQAEGLHTNSSAFKFPRDRSAGILQSKEPARQREHSGSVHWHQLRRPAGVKFCHLCKQGALFSRARMVSIFHQEHFLSMIGYASSCHVAM